MTEYLSPGIHVEETSFRAKPIEGVPTSTTVFVGPTGNGAAGLSPEPLTSTPEYGQIYGTAGLMWEAARAFFDEGGRRLLVFAVEPGGEPQGLEQLENVSGVALIAAPANPDAAGSLIRHVEAVRSRFALIDTPAGLDPHGAAALADSFDSSRAALYYPWIRRQGSTLPPSPFVAGIYARNDVDRAVYKAPANIQVKTATGLERELNRADQELLNPRRVNCIRSFSGRGHLVWGARTLSKDVGWKYVNVRRYFTYLEESIERGTRWAVFEPNGERLWAAVRGTIETFLLNEWQAGGLAGSKPEEAFFVRCDRTTMTQNDLDNGRLICLVGVAPVRPSEFVLFRIGQWTADSTRT